MSKKGQLKKQIDDCEREIRAYEQKRERSQTAIMRAMLAGKKASPEDEQYFNVFSNLIDQEREKLRGLYAELEELKKK
ncbi:MAG: hypothetical protein K2K13_00930 [Clostridiales bacterium]|nr:hypothetical protein [Clostridiales bacterium]MDE6617573.1 hypothetical protein [Clostridiales bacterium]